jgi:PAS domain S-box-containing protein
MSSRFQRSTLVSVTDTKVVSLTATPHSFMSGFAHEELLGQPHNLIRHPDMPAEAFRDLWQTISTGLPWTGLVKNRRKNGDFYWVQANITPLRDGEQITGFLSVRTPCARTCLSQKGCMPPCVLRRKLDVPSIRYAMAPYCAKT